MSSLSSAVTDDYHHVQRAPMCLLIYAVAAGQMTVACLIPMPPTVAYVFVAIAAVLVLLGASLHYLAVKDDVDLLRVQFGPISLFATSIRYNEITSFARDRTTLMESWGIHKSLRGGWVWNIWGRDCVVIHHTGITRVGTDDVENLLSLLSERTGIEPLKGEAAILV